MRVVSVVCKIPNENKQKKRQLSHINVFFFTMPPEHSSLGVGIKAPFKGTKMTCFSAYQGRDCQLSTLDGLNKEQTRDYSDHDFQVLVVHRQFLTTKQMDTNGALVRAGLKLMMIHQSVSPYTKYTSLILFEVIVEADVWICFGKLLNF